MIDITNYKKRAYGIVKLGVIKLTVHFHQINIEVTYQKTQSVFFYLFVKVEKTKLKSKSAIDM